MPQDIVIRRDQAEGAECRGGQPVQVPRPQAQRGRPNPSLIRCQVPRQLGYAEAENFVACDENFASARSMRLGRYQRGAFFFFVCLFF
jgi:hypothetical protein